MLYSVGAFINTLYSCSLWNSCSLWWIDFNSNSFFFKYKLKRRSSDWIRWGYYGHNRGYFQGKVIIFFNETGLVVSRKVKWLLTSTFVRVKRHLISWSTGAATFYFASHQYLALQTFFKNWIILLFRTSWVIENSIFGYFREIW